MVYFRAFFLEDSMKLLFDFFPILLFFIAFKFFGMYIATAVAMIASFLQVSIFWLKHRRFETMQIITLVCVLLLGGATLILHNAIFFKWKPTAIYWLFALVFFSTQFIGKKPLIQRLMQEKIMLPEKVWQHVNLSWVIFFAAMGGINLYVAYNFSTDIWVDFKLFGGLGLTALFAFLQAFYIAKHAEKKAEEKPPEKINEPK
jgi:intracellular septation protein